MSYRFRHSNLRFIFFMLFAVQLANANMNLQISNFESTLGFCNREIRTSNSLQESSDSIKSFSKNNLAFEQQEESSEDEEQLSGSQSSKNAVSNSFFASYLTPILVLQNFSSSIDVLTYASSTPLYLQYGILRL